MVYPPDYFRKWAIALQAETRTAPLSRLLIVRAVLARRPEYCADGFVYCSTGPPRRIWSSISDLSPWPNLHDRDMSRLAVNKHYPVGSFWLRAFSVSEFISGNRQPPYPRRVSMDSWRVKTRCVASASQTSLLYRILARKPGV